MTFSYERDVPILRFVRDATFISNEQLFASIMALSLEPNRRCFSWRVQRLVEGDLLRSFDPIWPYKGRVYGISRTGLSVLENCGEGLSSLTSESRSLPHESQVLHFLELNDIRGAFEKSGCLRRWRPESELTSMNQVADTPLAKDYDAIAEVLFGGNVFRVAIEHERSIKSSGRYRDINLALKNETRVDLVLYLTSAIDMVVRLAEEFSSPAIPICFASSWKFKQHRFSTNVLLRYGAMQEARPLTWTLENIARLCK